MRYKRAMFPYNLRVLSLSNIVPRIIESALSFRNLSIKKVGSSGCGSSSRGRGSRKVAVQGGKMEEVIEDNIVKSPQDKRSYRYYMLFMYSKVLLLLL